jgi:hypothetical protein
MALKDRLQDWRIKLMAASYVLQAGKVVPLSKLTLRRFAMEQERYAGLAEGLSQLPVPPFVRIGRKVFAVPSTVEEFCDTVCYGQVMYFKQREGFDVGIILRYVAGYFYPQYTQTGWDEKGALQFGAKILSLNVKELYPVSKHLVALMEQLVTQESKLLQRTPSRQEQAAGIERLGKFADLTSLLFLQDSFNCTEAEVMRQPYNDCLVRFMLAKEQAAFAERLTEVYRQDSKPKGGKG